MDHIGILRWKPYAKSCADQPEPGLARCHSALVTVLRQLLALRRNRCGASGAVTTSALLCSYVRSA